MRPPTLTRPGITSKGGVRPDTVTAEPGAVQGVAVQQASTARVDEPLPLVGLSRRESTRNRDLDMAIRVNVTAVRDCPPVEIRAVMSEVIRLACPGPECTPVGDQLDICEHAGWAWFTTSVWGVSAGDLNRGLCKLARPALQFSTSDGDRWFLTVHGGPGGQVHFLHEYSAHSHDPDPDEDDERQDQLDTSEEPTPVDPRLAFLEDDPTPGTDRLKVPFDLMADALNEMGARIPEEFRAAVAHLPYSAAVKRYREWHAEQVSDALAGAGISHDPAAVRSVLLWQNITETESDNDLGNLPRLLSVLGLGGQWDDWVRQAEAPPPEPEPEAEPDAEPEDADQAPPPPEREDPFGPVLAIVEPLALTPVAGGPFALPLDDLTLTRFFVDALSIHDTAGVVLTVSLPPDLDRTQRASPTGFEIGSVELTEDGFRAGMENHLWFSQRDLTRQLGDHLFELLYHLPDGSAIDLAFALADRPALTQRYRGPVEGGGWQITETFPPLTREALAGGTDLARYALGDSEKHKLRDEAEAAAVVELAKRDPNLRDMKVQRKGRTVRCGSDVVGHLPKVIFRHRFAAYWDVASHDREAERLHREHRDMMRNMRRAGVEAARRRAAPHDDDVLLRGKVGPYWRSDFAGLEQLEQETRGTIDAALEGLGFRHVGDLVAKRHRDIVLRTFAGADGLSYGTLLAKRTMYLGFEFFSRFADGSILTTTTNGTVESLPELKFFAQLHPVLGPAALHEKHRRGIERFRARRGTEPVPLDPTLPGVAREYDRALARREGVALRIRIISVPPGEPPAHIRAAWVGCVLPVFATTDDPKVGPRRRGVLSRKDEDCPSGFAVRVLDAVRALEGHNAEAARWWRENTPDLIKPGELFLYPGEACELVEEIETPG